MPEQLIYYELSEAQLGIWYDQNNILGSTNYNIGEYIVIPDQLDPVLFKKALVEVYSQLKLPRFQRVGTEETPRQVFDYQNHDPLMQLDFSKEDDPERRALEWMERNLRTLFDLTEGEQLIRDALIKIGPRCFYWYHCFHHMAVDAYGVNLVAQDVAGAYTALQKGETWPHPKNRVYFHYLEEESRYHASAAYAKDREYWLTKLSGRPEATSLTVKGHASLPEEGFIREPCHLNQEHSDGLRRIVEETGSSLTQLFNAIVGAYVYRMTGVESFLLGFPATGRMSRVSRQVAGMTANILPLMIEVSSNTTMRDLTTEIGRQIQPLLRRQRYRLHEIRRDQKLRPTDPNFFGVTVNVMPFDYVLRFGETEATNVNLSTGVIDDISISIYKPSDDNPINIFIDANPALYTKHELAAHSKRLIRLIEQTIEQFDIPVAEIDMISAEEKQYFQQWNATDRAYPKEETIVDLFESQVRKTPHHTAVVFQSQHLSYVELNKKANQLARHLLQRQGSESLSNQCIGICVERSLEMIIGLLGILKAGGAYVPLDPDYPSERLALMVEDSGMDLLLTQERLTASLPKTQVHTILLDGELDGIAKQSDSDLDIARASNDLAYVIYTSGATGQPKGVLIEHRSVVNVLCHYGAQLSVARGTHILLTSNYVFDASVEQIFGALIHGGTLFCIPKSTLLSESDFIDYVEKHQIHIIDLAPALLQKLVGNHDPLKSVQAVISGGEKLEQSLNDALIAKGYRLYNHYGPTETTIEALVFQCDDGKVSLGRPIQNVQCYILDKTGHLLPMGVSGELHIGGAGLARGYLNRPELTTERFIKHPFSHDTTARIYKTGDLARWLPDGTIEYLGRTDHQVKLRGLRIELGEIEAGISKHPAVREAAVILHTSEERKRLIAYYTSDESNLDLHAWLGRSLPDYMVPARFIHLDTMPLTSIGKIDRQALPELATEGDAEEYVPPRTGKERKLAHAWSQVLKREQIGINDNFFELGGDSILSIQIVAAARAVGLHLTPRDLFQHQTIAEQALVARSESGVRAEQDSVVGEIPLLPIQQDFFEWEFLDRNHFNQSAVVRISTTVPSKYLRKAFEKIIEHHDALRMHYNREEGRWRQYNAAYAQDEKAPFHMEDIRGVEQHEQATRIEEISAFYQGRLDIEAGPLQALVLVETGDNENVLFWVIHHLVVDGVSWRILLEDLETLLLQQTQNKSMQLPAKSSSYKQWSERLQGYAQSDVIRHEHSFWNALPEPPHLPMDTPDGLNRLVDQVSATFTLDEDQTSRLLNDIHGAYNTRINDVLLSALTQVFCEECNGEAFQLALERHGRTDLFPDIDLSRTAGWFTVIHPLHLVLPPQRDPGSILKSVKEQLRAVPQEGLGFGLLAHFCKPRLRQVTPPLLFNYLGQFSEDGSDDQQSILSGFELKGSDSPNNDERERNHILEINALIREGRLVLMWSYSQQQYRQETIQRLGNAYLDHLQTVIQHCQQKGNFGYSPSDFPLSELKQNELDALSATYGRNIADIYPLSPMQRGMLFHALYAPESGNYFVQLHFRLRGQLDPEVFHQAWEKLLERHGILRTAFLHQRDEMLQIVHKQVTLPWNSVDWRELDSQQQKKKFQDMLIREQEVGFQLDQAPLMRCTLIRLSDDSYRFVLSNHHILMDGWSTPIMFLDVLEAYQAILENRTSRRPRLPPYRTYIAWLQQQDHAAAEHYWRRLLQGIRTPTQVFTGKQEQARGNYKELQYEFSVEVAKKMRQFSNRHHVTISTLMQGGWGLLLLQYCGEKQALFGTTVSGRNIELDGVEGMLGLFINTLPLRVDAHECTAETFLRTLQDQHQESNQYAYSALTDIQSWSDIPAGTPLFESILVFENYPMKDVLHQPGFSFTVDDVVGEERTNYPLTLVVFPETQPVVKLSYDCDRFSHDEIQRMLGHLEMLIHGLVRQPEQSITTLPLLTQAEQLQLEAWNATDTIYSTHPTVIDLFEAQVQKTPHHTAVVFESQHLTYTDLNRKANQVAHYLRQQIGTHDLTDRRVGLCVERGMELIIGLLGIFKSGAAYVPLDPDYPQKRLAFMLEDSGVDLLLTQERLLEKLPQTAIPSVLLDEVWSEIARQKDSNLKITRAPESLAYVIYTSGSTGLPKGVMLEHRNLVNVIQWHAERFGITKRDKVLQFFSCAFDVSLSEIFMALTGGAELVLIHHQVTSNPDALHALVEASRVTVMLLPPTFLRLCAQREFSTLRVLITGGENVHEDDARHYGQHYEYYNAYGPTEAAICTSAHRIDPADAASWKGNIGRPNANTQIHILNANLQSLPIGVAGELYIAGAGLARGYLNRPELTTERFIPNPFSNDPADRLYKTGDRACWLPDGTIKYLGRTDRQIKLRGFRIELEEIEAVIRQESRVEEIAVVLHNHKDQKHLIAYYTAKEREPNLRSRLGNVLPNYMVPAQFIQLETMPLTANGKIDRQALPEPEQERGRAEVHTTTEDLLAVIWSSILKLERIDAQDDFFALGGHSLLATQLAIRIRQAFGVDLPLRTLFEHSLLHTQAQQIELSHKTDPLPPVRRVPPDTAIPLSFAQQRLWFLNRFEGHSTTYNICAALRLTGPLNRESLGRTLTHLTQRHDSLRMCFPEQDGQATVVLLPPYGPLKVVDLSQRTEFEKKAESERLITECAQFPFDLACGPLWRVILLEMEESHHILLFNMHHIIADGWSIGILLREWTELYRGWCEGEVDAAAILPQLDFQYQDFSHWQRRWLHGERLQSQLDYWETQLAGIPTLLELPTDRPRPTRQSYRGGTVRYQLSREMTVALKQLGGTQNATLFMTLLSTFQLLLSRYSGQMDICVGSPIANRHHDHSQNLVGYFVNTLVLRGRIHPEHDFNTLLEQTRRICLEAYTQQDIPFENLVEQLQPPRSQSHAPLFQVMFVLQNNQEAVWALEGLHIEAVEVSNTTAKFDLTLSVEETEQGMFCDWEYSCDLFDRERIERMAGHFEQLLKGIVEHPNRPMSSLPLLTSAEQLQLSEWQAVDATRSKDQTLIDLFETQVRKTPGHTALSFEGQSLTYDQLNRRANRLALHLLQQTGAENLSDQLIGLCVERGLETIIGLLGILKAGAAYVPMDPGYPQERLAFMLEDSRVGLLLTQKDLVTKLPQTGTGMIFLDGEWEAMAQYPENNLKLQRSSDSLAYVIYTSGSTGKPKGVMITHANVTRLFITTRNLFDFGAEDVWTLFHSFAFDFSVWEIWGAFLNGGKLVVVPYWVSRSPKEFYGLLQTEGVTVLNQTPSAFQSLIQEELKTNPQEEQKKLLLRWVIFGGEALHPQTLIPWFDQYSDSMPRLVNMYGITETTVHVTYRPLTRNSAQETKSLVGQAIPDLQVHILDKALQPMPIGVPGELHIAGAGLARGYLNRPDLTAERFIQNPFDGNPSSRLYRTGDLACWMADGTIEYLGRVDHQIQLRGFRIELGEIEASICQHSKVREAVVVLHEREMQKSLIAYYTSEEDSPDLRAWLSRSLPDYMIPARFIHLEAMPLTANGKIDRKRLPEPMIEKGRRNARTTTATEEMLGVIWSDLLQCERIDATDDFFALGGHSLLATRLATRIHQSFDVDLPLRTLFEYSELRTQAHQIELSQRTEPLPRIQRLSQNATIPLSYAQQRLWFLNRLEGDNVTYNISAAFKLTGPLHRDALSKALTHLTQRHDSLRMCFPEQHGRVTAELLAPYNPLEVIDLSPMTEAEKQAEVARLVSAHSQTPFDLSQGPLWRVTLLRLGSTDHIILLNIHHIIADGWSMGILVREWATLYRLWSQGMDDPKGVLPPLDIQYQDYAHWQRQWLEGDILQNQLAYWKERLSGIPELLELPTDRPRPACQSYKGGTVRRQLPQELTSALRQLGSSQNATLFMTLLSTFQLLLFRYSGHRDICVGTPIANRHHGDSQELIGFLVNTLVLRGRIEPEHDFNTLLEQTRKRCLEAYTHQDIPFENLVEQLQPHRSQSHSPLFQVMFVLQNDQETVLEMEGLHIEEFDMPHTVSRFDLTLNVGEMDTGLICDWEYSRDLFDRERIERMAGHFEQLLKGIVDQPGKSLSDLSLLTQEEVIQMNAWRAAHTVYSTDQTLIDLFESQVKKTPDHTALVFQGQRLTYIELNQKANQVARHLLHQTGAVNLTDRLIGLCVERGLEMIIGLLGILKSGAAYVPLDPAYPQERLAFMLQDSGVELLVTQEGLVDKLPQTEIGMTLLDAGWDEISQRPDSDLDVRRSPVGLAYVIYTSGSMGKPKGVMITHANVTRLFFTTSDHFNFKADDVWTLFHSFAFDFSVWEIWGALLYGGKLVVVPYWVSRSPSDFYELLQQERVTVLNQTPSAFQSLIQEDLRANLRENPSKLQLRWVIFGGEALHPQTLKVWFDRHSDTMPQLVNMYGITETTVHVTFRLLTEDSVHETQSLVGKPIPDLQAHILDNALQPVPIGVPGELHIAGAGLARGYLNRPELTTERFIPNPFSDDPSDRFYKTGDLARWLPDGSIEYLGRSDHQVQLRGFRIELGEIEAGLFQHDDVHEAAVVFNGGEDQKRLIAYYTSEKSIPNLRAWLGRTLPEYMVPVQFVHLETMPLTPNGKVDRKALPALGDVEVTSDYVPPRTEKERLLAQAWAKVLKQDRIGIYDNFFELGGDSILSIQIVAAAREVGLYLTPRELFQHQTVAEQAQIAKSESGIQPEQGSVVGEIPLLPIQQAFFSWEFPQRHHFNQSVLLRLPAQILPEHLRNALEKIVAHHDALRMLYREQAGGWSQSGTPFDKNGEIPFHVEDLRAVSHQEQASRIEELASTYQGRLNIETGPLQALVLMETGQEENRLLWVIHHLVVDGVSWRILLEDLESLIHQQKHQDPMQLPAKSSAYKQWSDRLRDYVRSDTMNREREFWRTLPEPQPLLMDNPKGSNRYADRVDLSSTLDEDLTRVLLSDIHSAYHTRINDVLLAALTLAFCEIGDREAFQLALEGHGRVDLFPEIDLSRTVGWFTSIHPVHLTLPPQRDLGTVLKSVKEQLRAVPQEGLGFGLLKYLSDRGLERPEPPLLFNYLGQFSQDVGEGHPTSLLRFAEEGTGISVSHQGARNHIFEINAFIQNGSLVITWSYSRQQYRESTVQRLAQAYLNHLQKIIFHCQRQENFGYSPSDFALSGLEQSEIDELCATYGRNIENIYPLSPMQRGMLFHTLYAPETGNYFVQLHFRIVGKLDTSAFRRAWERLLERHTILRTGFLYQRDELLQIVHKKVVLPWKNRDWSSLDPREQEEAFQHLLVQEQEDGFLLDQAPLARCILIRLDDESYRFVLNNHHILMDGWSLSILFTDLLEKYQTSLDNRPTRLSHPHPYRDYIAWLQRQDHEAAGNHWRQLFQGLSSPTQFTTGKPLKEGREYRELQLELDGGLAREMHRFSRQRHLTINTLVQGGWGLLLLRYIGEPHVLFGTTVSGRNIDLEGVEGMLGLFINTLPLRVDARECSAETFLRDIQTQHQESNQYAFSALTDIQSWSEIPAGTTMFESILVFENYPVEDIQQRSDSQITMEDFSGEERTNYPVTLVILPGAQPLIKLSYDSSRFDEAEMKRMLGHLEMLISRLVRHPEQRVATLPMLTPAEQSQLEAWNATDTVYPLDRTIIDLFEAQVKTNTDHTAVVFGAQHLDYGHLNRRANQVARHLLQQVGTQNLTDRPIGLCVERGLEMIIGLLAIFKTGAAYVPLDPEYPQDRLAFILEDSQVNLLLTQQRLTPRLPQTATQMVLLDAEWDGISEQEDDNLEIVRSPENLAYIIYTSGSTGRPKGVLLEHRNLVNAIYWHVERFGITPSDRILQFFSHAFDVSLAEIFMALIGGGQLVLTEPHVTTHPDTLHALVEAHQVTVMMLPPTFLRMCDHREFKSLRVLITGGENIHEEDARYYAQHHDYFNAYGPTEASICASAHHIVPDTKALLKGNIGRPNANTQIYILDTHLQPLPVGIPGDLHIAGAGLARGYLNHSELTAERFISNPFSSDPTARLYKTGDRACWLPDGNIEYLGRTDQQIKLRGFRIELGEIESAISQYPAVGEAVVILHTNEGQKSLVAYYTAKENHTELRSWLGRILPEYMIPAQFIQLETMPLTVNGKIDRKALPVPEAVEVVGEYLTPRTEKERKLIQVWSQVLNRDRISVNDNFFELGGDSILSILIVSKARAEGLNLTPKELFQHQTIAEQALVARSESGIMAEQGSVVGDIPLLPIQRAFFDWPLTQQHHFTQSVLLHLPARIPSEHLLTAFKKIIEHHDALRMRFYQKEGGWRQHNEAFDEQGAIPFHNEDLRGLTLQEQAAKIEEIAVALQRRLNFETGPLQALALMETGYEENRLFWVIHHLVVDGVSWRVLLEDLETLLRQQEQQNPTMQLPAKSSSYQQWSERLQEYAQSETLNRERPFWSTIPVPPSLPVDHPEGSNRYVDLDRQTVTLDEIQTSYLLSDIHGAYNTRINDVLLSALTLVFSEGVDRQGLQLTLEGHGRVDLFPEIDLSRTVGWFTSAYPVHLTLPSQQDLGAVLKSVKEQLRAIPQEGVGYGILEHLGHPPLERSTPPLLFNYLGQFSQDRVDGPQDSLLAFASEGTGHRIDHDGERNHILEINALIQNGCLMVTWSYSRQQYREETIQRFAQAYLQHIREIIRHCQQPDNYGYSPSDFALSGLKQIELDALRATFGRNIEDIYPLSPMQRDMLFHTSHTPETDSYFVQQTFLLGGAFDPDAFHQAWEQMLKRYGVLRSAFLHQRDEMFQIVHKQVVLPWITLDWCHLDDAKRDEALSELLMRERKRGFRMDQAPLIRCSMIRWCAEKYRFVFNIHHILMDGWSMPVLFMDLFETYQSILEQRPALLSPVTPYRDYIAWLQREDRRAAEQYWRHLLQGIRHPTQLPLGRWTKRVPEYKALYVTLDAGISQKVHRFSRQRHLTINTLVQGGWGLLLLRYSGEKNVLFGTTVSGRNIDLNRVEGMVGLLINTLPLRVDAQECQIETFLRDIQTQHQESNQYPFSALSDIQSWSEIPTSSTLFESLIVFENYPVDSSLQQFDAPITVEETSSQEWTHYPLTLTVFPETCPVIKLSYDSTRFSEMEMQRMLGHLELLISGMVRNPEKDINTLPMLTLEEQEQLETWKTGEFKMNQTE